MIKADEESNDIKSLEKSNNKFKKSIPHIISSILSIVISVALSFAFCTNYLELFLNWGCEKAQIQLADSSRKNNDYDTAITNYERIMKRNDSYYPYACIALAEINYKDLQSPNYNAAFEYYKKAIDKSDDIYVLSSAMRFIINQIDLYEQYGQSDEDEKPVDFIDENSEFAAKLFNKINNTYPEIFKNCDLSFPVDEDDVFEIFYNKNGIKINSNIWEYDYTTESTDGSLAYVKDDERLVYVDSWSEPVNSTDAAMKVYYKFYHYVKKEVSQKYNADDAILMLLPEYEKIYLGDL